MLTPYSILFVGLFCISVVRSQWIFSRPCTNNNVTLNYGTLVSGACQQYFGQASYSECNDQQTLWTYYSGPDARNAVARNGCSGGSCEEVKEYPMNRCKNGFYSTCTSDNLLDFTTLGFPAAGVELYPGNRCDGFPYTAYVAQQDKCFNYSPQNTRYNSFSVTCKKNGREAKVALYARRNCADLSQTLVLATGNCTTAPDFLDEMIPIMVSCSN
jgi:hypothetical protein